MARKERERKRAPKETARRGKPKVCLFCKEHIDWVDYKDVNLLRRYMSDRGKIRTRRVSGNCTQHQREVAVAIKTARELALLPYTQRTISERGGPRGRPPRGGDGRDGYVPAAEAAGVIEADIADLSALGGIEDGEIDGDVLVDAYAAEGDEGDEGDREPPGEAGYRPPDDIEEG